MNKITMLGTGNGETLDFYCDAKIPLGDYVYEVLRPVKKFDGLDPDEAIVFRTFENEDGSIGYEIEEDDEVISEIEKVWLFMVGGLFSFTILTVTLTNPEDCGPLTVCVSVAALSLIFT